MTNLHSKIDTFKEQHPLWHVVFETCMLFILMGLAFFVIRTMMSWRLSLPGEIVRHLFPTTILLLAVLIAYTVIKPTKVKASVCLVVFTGLLFWTPSSEELLETGRQYATGSKLLEKNEEYAKACYDKAAEFAELDEKTDSLTLLYLGSAYAVGDCVDKNEAKADWFFHKYAEETATPEDTLASIYYITGHANIQCCSTAEGEKWFRKAGDLKEEDYSFARCCFLTGKAYALGDGVEINSAEAEKWFRKAAEEGDEFPIARSYRLMETEWYARDGEDAMNESAKWKRKADEAELNSQS